MRILRKGIFSTSGTGRRRGFASSRTLHFVRVNEAEKFGWEQYCSIECQSKARATKVKKPCGNPNCKKVISRYLNQFKKSRSGLIFCSRSCAAKVNNKEHPKRQMKLRICRFCHKRFKGDRKKKYCSEQCKLKASHAHTPKEILGIIKRTAQELRRVPARRELKGINSACRKIFGSWNNAVLAAGFTPNRSHDNRMYKRANAKASDGHLCDSVSELLIDNWLYKNNIPHNREASYPNTHHKADWEILSQNQKTFIEYFGLANDSPRYDRSIKKKKKLCTENKIKLIPIYHWELYPKRRFGEKIKQGLVN